MPRELSFAQLTSRSIMTTYHKVLWTPFVKALKAYEMLKPNDCVAVCVSGGKDSFLLAKLFAQLHEHSDFPFGLIFLSMNPGYTLADKQKVRDNALRLGIDLTYFDSDIYQITSSLSDGSPCYLCARMRRGALYAKAKELGANKIALAHHMNDVIETTLMSMFSGGQFETMMPKLKSANFPGMELIRPLYMVKEKDIINWKQHHGLDFIHCGCPRCASDFCPAEQRKTGNRAATKELIKELAKKNPYVEANIFNSLHNVNLDTLIGWKLNGQKHSFLDYYL